MSASDTEDNDDNDQLIFDLDDVFNPEVLPFIELSPIDFILSEPEDEQQKSSSVEDNFNVGVNENYDIPENNPKSEPIEPQLIDNSIHQYNCFANKESFSNFNPAYMPWIAPQNNPLLFSNYIKTSSCRVFRKNKSELSPKADEFRTKLCHLFFKNKKRMDKKIVANIMHFLYEKYNFPKMNRNEVRTISLFYEHYAPYAEKIIELTKNNHKEISNKFKL